MLLKLSSFSWYCVRPVKGRLDFIKQVFLVGCTKSQFYKAPWSLREPMQAKGHLHENKRNSLNHTCSGVGVI